MPIAIHSRRRMRLLALPVVATGMIVLAACGTTSTSSASAAGGGTDAFAACMAENGVTAPTGGPGRGSGGGTPPTGTPHAGDGGTRPDGTRGAMQAPPGVDATTWAAALKACADVAPTPPGGAAATPAAGA